MLHHGTVLRRNTAALAGERVDAHRASSSEQVVLVLEERLELRLVQTLRRRCQRVEMTRRHLRLAERIFEAGCSRSGGTGLGLHAVKTTVAACDGKVRCVPLAVGTRFTISLPRAEYALA